MKIDVRAGDRRRVGCAEVGTIEVAVLEGWKILMYASLSFGSKS